MMPPEYERLLTPGFRMAIDRQTDSELLEEELHTLRQRLRASQSGFDRQVLVIKMQYIHDRLAQLAAEANEEDL